MTTFTILILGWLGLASIFALGWEWGRRRTNAGIVDVLWALTLVLLVGWFAWQAEGAVERRVLLAGCAGLWGVRLGLHIWGRVRAEAEEDARYAYLRSHWGPAATRNFFIFFQAQAIANLLLGLPILLLMTNARALTGWDLAGAVIIVASVWGERLADRQLAAWRKEPQNRGKTCRRGLWAWSRHPNYFFEWTHWLAYPVMGGALWGTGLVLWWPLTLLGPVVMLFLLLRATGIPYTEKQALKSRGEDYRRYQAEVSAFVPWWPKRR